MFQLPVEISGMFIIAELKHLCEAKIVQQFNRARQSLYPCWTGHVCVSCITDHNNVPRCKYSIHVFFQLTFLSSSALTDVQLKYQCRIQLSLIQWSWRITVIVLLSLWVGGGSDRRVHENVITQLHCPLRYYRRSVLEMTTNCLGNALMHLDDFRKVKVWGIPFTTKMENILL